MPKNASPPPAGTLKIAEPTERLGNKPFARQCAVRHTRSVRRNNCECPPLILLCDLGGLCGESSGLDIARRQPSGNPALRVDHDCLCSFADRIRSRLDLWRC
jgi:hypothetical protein